ncbi:murein biosynthesis integral membrane protein MurJ [Rhodococcus jostii]|uniref:murein biosynthesis integral membrane protein MurJ n=2 Tax=Rhodococcus jostii TaxID=132919 RepID=UPI003630B01E
MSDTENTPSDGASAIAASGGRVAAAALVSRITGFARTLALAAVLGAGPVADAFNGANTFPTMVYELLIGGVLASVLIPMLTTATQNGAEYGRDFTQRMLALTTLALAVVTVIAVTAAPLLARMFVTDPAQRTLTTMLAYLLLPEIFFYGLTAAASAVLAAGGNFAAPAWAPVLSNLIIIATTALFWATPGPATLTAESMSTPQILILGIGTTLAVAAQTLAVLIALHCSGFRWHRQVRILPGSWAPIRVLGARAGWVLGYMVISQVEVAVLIRVAFDHGGVSVFTYTDLLFQVPFGILAVSLLTVLTPRISRAMAGGNIPAVIADLGRGTRYLTAALVPITGAVMLLGPSLVTVMFTGRVTANQAQLVGTAPAATFGLLPLAVVMGATADLLRRPRHPHPHPDQPGHNHTKTLLVTAAAAALDDRQVIITLTVAASASSWIHRCGVGVGESKRRDALAC